MRIWLAAAVFAFWLLGEYHAGRSHHWYGGYGAFGWLLPGAALAGAGEGGLPDEARTHAPH